MQAVPSSTKHLTTKASLVDERPVLFFCPMSLVVVQQEIAQLVWTFQTANTNLSAELLHIPYT